MADIPTVAARDIPFLTTDQMIEVDRAMMEDFGILLLQMMEHAGRNLASLSRSRFLDGDPRGRRVTVLTGPGGNGGGAMVAARRLAAWGADVEVFLATAEQAEVPTHQRKILEVMGVPVRPADEVGGASELILDGVLGYSLSGDPHGGAKTLIEWANAASAPVLSLDAPSGIDTTSGRIAEPAVKATATMTLALPKQGLLEAAGQLGELYLADISVPPVLYFRMGLEVGSIFAESDILRVAL
jgi:NAD(P)H-hydrate epimerase